MRFIGIKSATAAALALLGLFVAGLFLYSGSPATADEGGRPHAAAAKDAALKARSVEAESITIAAKDGKGRIEMGTFGGITGIWLRSDDRPTPHAAMYADRDGTLVLQLWGLDEGGGPSVAIAAPRGKPARLQVGHPGESIGGSSIVELQDLVKGIKPPPR